MRWWIFNTTRFAASVVVTMVVISTSAHAESRATNRPLSREVARTARRLEIRGNDPNTTSFRSGPDRSSELRANDPRPGDPPIARSRLVPQLRDLPSVIERASTWVDPEKPAEEKEWRPRVMVLPLSSMSTGTGVKVKIRW